MQGKKIKNGALESALDTFLAEKEYLVMGFEKDASNVYHRVFKDRLDNYALMSPVFAMNGALMGLFNHAAPGMIPPDLLHGWTGMLIEYPVILLSLAVSYAVFSLLIRIPPVNALFAWTTLTRFYRRTRDPETRLDDFRKF